MCVEGDSHPLHTNLPTAESSGSSGLTTNGAGLHASRQGMECASQNWLSRGTCSVLGQPWGPRSRSPVPWCVEGLGCPAPLHSQVCPSGLSWEVVSQDLQAALPPAELRVFCHAQFLSAITQDDSKQQPSSYRPSARSQACPLSQRPRLVCSEAGACDQTVSHSPARARALPSRPHCGHVLGYLS